MLVNKMVMREFLIRTDLLQCPPANMAGLLAIVVYYETAADSNDLLASVVGMLFVILLHIETGRFEVQEDTLYERSCPFSPASSFS